MTVNALSLDSQIRGSIEDFLETLPPAFFNKLFSQPATCLAILRLLPPLAQQIVFRLLYILQPIPYSDIECWCYVPQHKRTLRESLDRIAKLHVATIPNAILYPHNHHQNQQSSTDISLNPVFQENLHYALIGGGSHTTFGLESDTADKYKVDLEFLDKYATEQWEMVLHFMVGTTATTPPPTGVLNLLLQSGLMSRDETDNQLRITNKGFQFLLQDINTQVWALLLQYLQMTDDLQMDLAEVLGFLFTLGSLELGQDYSLETLSEAQITMLRDLQPLGIIYQRKKNSRRFYPTRLATSLVSGHHTLSSPTSSAPTGFLSTGSNSLIPSAPSSAAGTAFATAFQNASSTGFIVLETNYRIYAYTDSPLQIAVLSLFCSLRARFRNMVIGMITRDSVREALANGITADQIIAFLTHNAHSEMKKTLPVVPITVVDQIKLWELEKNRLTISKSVLYQDFSRFEDYQNTMSYAEELGALLWSNDKRRLLIIKDTAHATVKAFVRREREKAKGGE